MDANLHKCFFKMNCERGFIFQHFVNKGGVFFKDSELVLIRVYSWFIKSGVF